MCFLVFFAKHNFKVKKFMSLNKGEGLLQQGTQLCVSLQFKMSIFGLFIGGYKIETSSGNS